MTSPAASPLRRRLLLALPALTSVLVVPPVRATSRAVQMHNTLMGTRVDLTLDGVTPAAAERAAQAAFHEMARLEAMMSRYRPDSVVQALHTAAGIRPLAVPQELFAVLEAAQSMAQASAGAFDVTVGAYREWDFTTPTPHIPSAATLRAERRLVHYRDLELDPLQRTAFLKRRGMRLDLGGIAKLPILQAGMSTLQAHGIEHAMLNGGGDVLVMGRIDGRPWRVGIRDPRQPERLLGSLALERGIVASSGDYERFFMAEGRRMHHVLDPNTGYPSQGPHGVALVCDQIAPVNGLGAAIMVAGAAKGQQAILSRFGVHGLIVDADGQVWQSAGMAERLQHA